MIRKLLATTALATLLSTAAFAQTQPAQPDAMAPAQPASPAEQATPAAPAITAQGQLATNIIGESVYNGSGDQAQNIGDVNDIVIGDDGQVQAVVVGVGGFLGIGEKNVAVDYSKLNWAEGNGDRWLVTDVSKEQLESMPGFERGAYDAAPAVATDTTAQPGVVAPLPSDTSAQAPAEPAAPADETAQVPAATDHQAAPADQSAQSEQAVPDTTTTAAIDKSTLQPFDTGTVKAEELLGTAVYGANDENIGEIGDIVLTADGKVDAYIIDVGGFLGIGEKQVAVGSDKLAFMTDADGNKYLYTKFTKEQLDAAATYDKGSYAEKRDDQRLMVQ